MSIEEVYFRIPLKNFLLYIRRLYHHTDQVCRNNKQTILSERSRKQEFKFILMTNKKQITPPLQKKIKNNKIAKKIKYHPSTPPPLKKTGGGDNQSIKKVSKIAY